MKPLPLIGLPLTLLAGILCLKYLPMGANVPVAVVCFLFSFICVLSLAGGPHNKKP